MGARGYPDDLPDRMELIWGIRHIVVHRAGVADAEFVRRHSKVVAAAGNRVPVGMGDLRNFLNAVGEFVNPTDAYFLNRCPTLATTDERP
jgi:hypothetical protein